MGEHSLDQSVWGRARENTIRSAGTLRFKVTEVISVPVAGTLAGTLAPDQWSNAGKAWFVAGVAIATALGIVGLVYIGSVALALYWQRNEARALAPQRISNDVSGIMQRLIQELQENISRSGFSTSHPDNMWLEKLYTHPDFAGLPNNIQRAVLDTRKRTGDQISLGQRGYGGTTAVKAHQNYYVPTANKLRDLIGQELSREE